MSWFQKITNTGFTILIIIIIIYYIYELFTDSKPKTELDNYEAFGKELQADMDKYGINNKDQERIEKIVESIVEKKKKEKNIKNIVGACKNGLIRGCIVGFLSGGIPGAISSGTTYGIINGFMHGVVE
jgi:hypothetical protein